jgi:hypothetical protein
MDQTNGTLDLENTSHGVKIRMSTFNYFDFLLCITMSSYVIKSYHFLLVNFLTSVHSLMKPNVA